MPKLLKILEAEQIHLKTMKYTELKFNTINETIVYQNLKLQYLGDEKAASSYGESIGKICNETNDLIIRQVVDNSQTVEVARIFIIQSDKSSSIVLLGGLTLLRISRSLESEEVISLPGRDKEDEEYWRLSLEEIGNIIICSYEAGLIFIDDNLQILGTYPKGYDEELFVPDKDMIYLLSPDGERRSISTAL